MEDRNVLIGKESFRTHYNYICALRSLMEGATLTYAHMMRITPTSLPLLNHKENLIGLTKRSLLDEAKIVRVDRDYSYASTSWLPIKSYYLLFNQLLTIEYLIASDPKAYETGHTSCSERFTKRLASKEVLFNNPRLNAVYDKTIFAYHEAPGSNLRRSETPKEHAKLALKKIAEYKMQDWKRRKKISSFRTDADKKRKQDFLNAFQLSIFEFPYYMRLRANYRDFAFIEGVSSTETAQYFDAYLDFTRHFYRALASLRTQLVAARMS